MLSVVGDHAICACIRRLMEPVLALWEYLITLTHEVNIFWRKPKTATSLLLVITRWNMVAIALLQIVPTAGTMFGCILLPHVSDINIFPSNCEALIWVIYMLHTAGYIEIACKQAHFIVVHLSCVYSHT